MALIADVFDVVLVDDSGNVVATTTLQDANIDVKVTESEVRGGKGDQLLAILHSRRDIEITLTDAEFKYDWLAVQLGKSITTGAGTGWAMPKWYTAATTTGVTITLDEQPLASNSGLVIYKADGTLIAGTNYSVSTKTVTFTSGVTTGDKVEVRTYQYATTATTQTLLIDNTTFAKGLKCMLETLELANDETPKYKLQYQFDEAMPTGNFAISTKSEKSASAQKFDLKVIKPANTDVIGRVLRIPIA